MSKWTADFTNDPFNDYEIVVEILYHDEEIAVIKQGSDGLEMKWYAAETDIVIPVEWLSNLLNQAKEKLIIK
jgi:hypothetical protein